MKEYKIDPVNPDLSYVYYSELSKRHNINILVFRNNLWTELFTGKLDGPVYMIYENGSKFFMPVSTKIPFLFEINYQTAKTIHVQVANTLALVAEMDASEDILKGLSPEFKEPAIKKATDFRAIADRITKEFAPSAQAPPQASLGSKSLDPASAPRVQAPSQAGTLTLPKGFINTDKNFYESQSDLQSCGRHALNNLLGGAFFTKGNTKDPYKLENRHQLPIPLNNVCRLLTDNIGDQEGDKLKCQEGENYDIDVLRAGLKIAGYNVVEDIDAEANFSTYSNLKTNPTDIGFLVNLERGLHWAAFQKVDDNTYLLKDSMKSTVSSINDLPKFILQNKLRYTRYLKVAYTGYINPLLKYMEQKQIQDEETNKAESIAKKKKAIIDEIDKTPKILRDLKDRFIFIIKNYEGKSEDFDKLETRIETSTNLNTLIKELENDYITKIKNSIINDYFDQITDDDIRENFIKILRNTTELKNIIYLKKIIDEGRIRGSSSNAVISNIERQVRPPKGGKRTLKQRKSRNTRKLRKKNRTSTSKQGRRRKIYKTRRN